MNLIDVTSKLQTEEQCVAFLEKVRWPNGVRCQMCGGDKISRIERKKPGKNKRVSLYTCLEPTCQWQFSVTSGTMFNNSHVPLHKWFLAVALMVDAKKGMSALQMQRHLKVSYRTAWYLAHRIRKSMEENAGRPLLSGTVEIDETYIGGRQRGHKGKQSNKDVVVGIRERGGSLRLVQAENSKQDTLYNIVAEHVSPDAQQIVTDENPAYNFSLTKLRRIKHSRIRHRDHVYVRGDVHTNTIESAFSLFKRGIVGSFHKVSSKHLQRYLTEFEYRFDRRESPDLFGMVLGRMTQPGILPYEKLIAN
jgi:transposase-like protein